MKPSIQLIEALRRAATRIEDPNGGYCWQFGHRCNCGMLYRELLGRDAPSYVGPWRMAAAVQDKGPNQFNEPNQFCEIAGRMVDDVVMELMGCGLTRIDIACIERCGDVVVLRRMGLGISGNYCSARDGTKYDEPAFVARYFRAQADILEEELTNLRHGDNGRSEPPANHSCGDSLKVGASSRLQTANPTQVARPMPQSPSQPVACVHLYLTMGDSCVLCSHVKIATSPVKEPA